MAAVASVFPDLDLTLAVSRVEVVSNVEIETIKTALRWLFDQAQGQRKAAEMSDPSATQSQVDDLNKRLQQQTACVSALQEQQVPQPRDVANYLASLYRVMTCVGESKPVPDHLHRCAARGHCMLQFANMTLP